MLYNHQHQKWKIADFGISSVATSKIAQPTKYARGTECYRAPELLTPPLTFSNKVDIWALGCILYELVTGEFAFSTDWHTREYSLDGTQIRVSAPELSPFVLHHITEIIHHLLSREKSRRPSATTSCLLLSSYLMFSEISDFEQIFSLKSYPSYSEWRDLIESHPTKKGFLLQLTKLYEEKGDLTAAIIIRQEFGTEDISPECSNIFTNSDVIFQPNLELIIGINFGTSFTSVAYAYYRWNGSGGLSGNSLCRMAEEVVTEVLAKYCQL